MLVWKLLLFKDLIHFYNHNFQIFHLGNGVMWGFGIIIAAAMLILLSEQFRKKALKEGRDLEDVRSFLRYTIYICITLILILSSLASE